MEWRIFLAFAFALAIEVPAAAADLSGTWAITGGGLIPICTLVQTGKYLGGSCKSPGTEGIVFGVIDGQQIRLSYQWTDLDKNPGAFDFVGQLDSSDNIAGIMMVGAATGPFAASRQ